MNPCTVFFLTAKYSEKMLQSFQKCRKMEEDPHKNFNQITENTDKDQKGRGNKFVKRKE